MNFIPDTPLDSVEMQNLIKNVRSAVFRIFCTYIHFCGDSAGRRIVPFPQCMK